MRAICVFFSLVLILASCGTQQTTSNKARKPITLKKNTGTTTTQSTSKKGTTSSKSTTNDKKYNTILEASGSAKDVIQEAKKYLGTQYKLGGTSKEGIDCSGLTSVSYKAIQVTLQRRSADQAKQGIEVKQKDAKPGDLLFFNTSGTGVSHTGIIESIKDSEIFFIHASTSKGVMISSLEESYWKPKLVTIRRIIE